MRRNRSILVLLAAFAVSQVASAQFMDYGELGTKDPNAFEAAGIVSYNLVRQDGGAYSIELQGEEGLQASCEVILGEIRVAKCHLPARGDFRVEYGSYGATFEDLNSGESFRQLFETAPTEAPGGFSTIFEESVVASRVELVLESAMGQDEIIRRWGDVFPVLGHAITEVQLTLGQDPSIQAKVRGQESDISAESQSIITCPDGGMPICGGIGGYAANRLGLTESICCHLARSTANTLCWQATSQACCALTNCISVEYILFWSCGLDGKPFVCSCV
ncbi:MAG: hypothetical protein K0U98_05760 [Deltaproteobacteria bacterium]|nr:hypothetical protein [Deltaproteobacteria bacterium]